MFFPEVPCSYPFSLLVLASGSRQSAPPTAAFADKTDTVFLPAACPPAVALAPDTVCLPYFVVDSALIRRNDSLYAKLLVANLKLGRIRFYSDIVARNPSQIKFYRGWINRVLEE